MEPVECRSPAATIPITSLAKRPPSSMELVKIRPPRPTECCDSLRSEETEVVRVLKRLADGSRPSATFGESAFAARLLCLMNNACCLPLGIYSTLRGLMRGGHGGGRRFLRRLRRSSYGVIGDFPTDNAGQTTLQKARKIRMRRRRHGWRLCRQSSRQLFQPCRQRGRHP